MKKVLMVSCDGLGNGGVQAVIMNIVRKLYKEYCFDILLFTKEKRYFDDEFVSYGGKIFRIPRYDGSVLFRRKMDYYIRGFHLYKKVKNLLLENGPYDIVHCHDEAESAVIIEAAKDVGVPVRIVHTHVIKQKGNPVLMALDWKRRRTIHEVATHKIGCSNEACRSFYLEKDYIVVNNAFDESRYHIIEDVKKTSLNFVQIGRISEIKNQLFSINVFRHILKENQDATFNFIGYSDGDYYDKVIEEIKKYHLEKCVHLLPGNADSPAILTRSAAMLFPSTHEGFGIVLVEAQAMGVRCYASDGVPRSTDCGGVTYLPLSEGPQKWAQRIMTDYKLESGKHHQYDVTRFTSKEVIKKIREIYEGK